MSHWHRAPRAFSVKALLLRKKLNFIVDHGVAVDLATYLPPGTLIPDPSSRDQQPSRQELLKLCRQKQGVLITADPAYVSLLIQDSKSSWGILLLPASKAVQVNVVRRLFAGTLAIRPSVERMAMVEYVSRNRLLVDMRYEEPVIGVFTDCRWTS
jgi:hypothetical protein